MEVKMDFDELAQALPRMLCGRDVYVSVHHRASGDTLLSTRGSVRRVESDVGPGKRRRLSVAIGDDHNFFNERVTVPEEGFDPGRLVPADHGW